MKKLVVIALMLMYGVSVSGMTLHIHYCCGEVDAIDFVPVKKDNCPTGNTITKKGCCDDRQIELKIKTDYNTEVLKSVGKIAYLPVAVEPSFAVTIADCNNPLHYFNDPSPPLPADIPLYIMHCIYRI